MSFVVSGVSADGEPVSVSGTICSSSPVHNERRAIYFLPMAGEVGLRKGHDAVIVGHGVASGSRAQPQGLAPL
jgi:hypothetical protein